MNFQHFTLFSKLNCYILISDSQWEFRIKMEISSPSHYAIKHGLVFFLVIPYSTLCQLNGISMLTRKFQYFSTTHVVVMFHVESRFHTTSIGSGILHGCPNPHEASGMEPEINMRVCYLSRKRYIKYYA